MSRIMKILEEEMSRYLFRFLPRWFVKEISAQLGHPDSSVYGRMTEGLLLYMNTHLEKSAVRLCDIHPNDRVLEVGFGPGIGLQEAHKLIKDGDGILYGIDKSAQMMKLASQRVETGLKNGNVVLFRGCATNIPLATDWVDHVFHSNCYYFWPDVQDVLHEIRRVMKPGARMVTTLSSSNLRNAVENGFLTKDQVDPVTYMRHLKECGFENVHIDHLRDPVFKWRFQVVSAQVKE